VEKPPGVKTGGPIGLKTRFPGKKAIPGSFLPRACQNRVIRIGEKLLTPGASITKLGPLPAKGFGLFGGNKNKGFARLYPWLKMPNDKPAFPWFFNSGKSPVQNCPISLIPAGNMVWPNLNSPKVIRQLTNVPKKALIW